MVTLESPAMSPRPKNVSCPACECGDCTFAISYDRFPVFLFPLAEQKARSVATKKLALHRCRRCGHVFQPFVDGSLMELIYTDYYANYPYDGSESFLPVYREPFDTVFRLLASTQRSFRGGQLIEIGCSSASNLRPFLEHGFSCIGIDPSPLAKTRQPAEGITILHGFYERVRTPVPANVIVSRFCLEHVVDVSMHLDKMRTDLRENGVVVIQVPNVDYYFENAQPLFVAHEHVHYFCLHSLEALFHRFGFSLVASYDAHQPSIIACFERRSGNGLSTTAPDDRIGHFATTTDAAKATLKACLDPTEDLILYGCGLAMIWVLNEVGLADLDRVSIVDDNASVWGKHVPASGLEVVAPEASLFGNSPTVMLTMNPVYHGQVIRRLERMRLPMRLIHLDKDGVRETFLGRA